ncbi:uncharacterized protein LOC123203433 [Mangifera indica]|uniref:uncharacterized protein LOC123203433 n=1 Tax=Mangifera indica TaxID=29780 RepID=UPI001CF92F8C|nr:uncharacterized protein LOC123203433 [Mangifera indica]
MEGRVKEVEENFKNLTEKVASMDDRFIKVEHHTAFRFDKLDENLHEIRQLLLKDMKGKENETVATSPTVIQEPPQNSPELATNGGDFGFQQPIPPPQQPLNPYNYGVVFGESSRNQRPPRYAAVESTNSRDQYHRKQVRPKSSVPLQTTLFDACEDDEQEVTKIPNEDSQPKLRQGDELELSRHFVAGISTLKTLKFLGKIHNSSVVIPVDSDASHSFISQQLVHQLQLPVSPTKFQVVIGNGSTVTGGEKCLGVKLLLPEMEFIHDYYVFPLGNMDVILGVDCHCYWIELAASETILEECSEAVQGILANFQHLFEEPTGLPPRRTHDHAIHLFDRVAPPNPQPVFQSYSSNAKEDGGWRFCVDCRAFNKIAVLDKFSIPVIDELLDELSGATIFTKLDLKSGYHQIKIVDSDVEKTAFQTHNDHYEFLVMPFGLSNAPATFQALINEVFRAHLRQFILVFFDDILIYSRDVTAHLDHLSLALQLLSDHHLLLNKKKCSFGVSRLEYPDHIILVEGVAADPQKI